MPKNETPAQIATRTYRGGADAIRRLEQKPNKTEAERQAVITLDVWREQGQA